MMSIKLINRDNIKEIEYSENTKIEDILKQEQIPIESVVVKQDGETVSEKEFVKDGSEIEIIKVIYGG
ncbi:MAG: MoaD/ThiS family protein [Methanobrevibacter sp.]|nr:MoaD/ThiS family protein [Methanobrevibacter sp.]